MYEINQPVISIDIGNTITKLGYFQEGKLRKVTKFKNNDGVSAEILKKNTADIVLISSVNENMEKNLLSKLKVKKVYIVGKNIDINKLELKFKYTNLNKLGSDRICFAFYSFTRFHKSILNVSMGTALVIDHIDDKGEFAGGVIIPGITLQLQSLKQCDKLHKARFKMTESKILGNNTDECISIGISLSIVNIIKFYKEKTKCRNVVISGGDYEKIRPLLNRYINYVYQPNAVILGLYDLYKYLLLL